MTVTLGYAGSLYELLDLAKAELVEYIKEAESPKERECLASIYQYIGMTLEANEQFNQRCEIDIMDLVHNRGDITKTISRVSSTKVEKTRANPDVHFFI